MSRVLKFAFYLVFLNNHLTAFIVYSIKLKTPEIKPNRTKNDSIILFLMFYPSLGKGIKRFMYHTRCSIFCQYCYFKVKTR